MNNISSKELRRAADIRDQIDAAQAELEAILSGQPAKGKPGRKPGAKKAVSTGPKPEPKPKAKKKAKSKMSDAGRARIVAAQKKRWAAKRKADKAAAK
jgi:hypothetical protein